MSPSPQPTSPRRHPLAPLATPFVWFCLRLRLPPIFFTLLSLPLAGTALWLLVQEHFFLAVAAVFAAAGADAMDGAVARAQGKASLAGGYLDSMTDRLVDLLVLLGIMIAAGETRSWIAGSLALFGTLTTSAAKWRLQQDVSGPLPLGRDLVARTDRYVLILAGILLTGSLESTDQAAGLFWLLVVLAGATILSTLITGWKAWRALRRADRDHP